MPVFTVTGDVDPFLHVSLNKGEAIFCESDAMVMMEASLDLSGTVQGGIFQAAMRRFANGESFFQQRIEATRGAGDCLLSPTMPGGVEVLDVGARQYLLSDGAYVAATSGVQVTARSQGLGNALFAGTGGFFVGQSSGSGQLAVNGFGSLFRLDVQPGKDIIIDNGHVVAWDATLQYGLSASTNASRGFLGNLVGSMTSGEGMVLKFSGQGQVLVCSRNKDSFLAWLASKISPKSS
ncbi:MAG: TIGR00266 family protein [Burkholderiaceae bacterium]|nr:TIGR00266 family protein [Burkholderiaceae bacterium]